MTKSKIKLPASKASSPAKVPPHMWSNDDVIDVAADMFKGASAGDAIRKVLERNTALLASLNLSLANFPKPGQSKSTFEAELNKRIDNDPAFKHRAIQAGIQVP